MDDIDISSMTKDDVIATTLEEMYLFLYYCETERNNKPTTRKARAKAIRSFFSYVKKIKGWIDKNPAEELESPKINKRLPIYL